MNSKSVSVLAFLSTLFFSPAFADKPNILFFFVDDMGWQDTSVSFHSSETELNRQYRTPNMERLAKKGLLFTSAYACSICSPSRVSLMTGQNAARHGVTCWTLRKDRSPERPNKNFASSQWPLNGLQPVDSKITRSYQSKTLPQALQKAGYRTIHAGKAHFGAQNTPGADPQTLGFDINIAGCHIGGPGSYHGDKNFSARWRNGEAIWDVPGLEKYHGQKINLTEAITREAISAVEKSVEDKKPFYLYLSHYAVHAPFEPDRRFLPNYKDKKWKAHQKTYASMLESMDHSLGQILDTLDRLKISDNTIVVFMSDNGSPGNNPQNTPLRGSKISGYEGGTRVPLIVHWPKITPENQRTNSPMIIEDIYPTFLEIAGVKMEQKIDGQSFTDILKNPTTDRSKRPLFWHYPNLYHLPPYSSVRLGNHKLIHWHLTNELELFDLKNDIGEKNNLASQQPQKVNLLSKILANHLRETKAFRLTKKSSTSFVSYPDEL
ncbi:MAG: arylsulfatase A-like enzyme [Akkermansiaceae bacterium]|jgi:arylsulfatase A-like enzyme